MGPSILILVDQCLWVVSKEGVRMLRQIAPSTMVSIGSISQEEVLSPAGKLECHTMVPLTNTQRF